MKPTALRVLTAALLSGAALALQPTAAGAQQACGSALPARAWPAPLDRRISLRARNVSLREALDRVAAAARFRVSYSAEFLPLDRHVCMSSDSIAAGDALAELLSGVNVSPVVTSADQVVIAPAGPAPRAQRESVQTLERVVVTGSATGNAQRPLSIALDVIDRKQVEESSSGTLSASFDGNVAGLWVWEQSPSSLLARYGSIRGASSFGVSYPKVYIDGIEVANPLLVTDLNPASLDRIEVIRGPQGAALYGADAISGVVNVITRHEGSAAGRAEINSRAGVSQTSFADGAALAQNHSLSWRAGSSTRSGSLGLNVSTLGGYVPEAFSRDLKLNGGFRVVTSGASVAGSARVYAKRAAVGQNPLIVGFLPAGGAPTRDAGTSYLMGPGDSTRLASDTLPPQTVEQYTVGITSTLLSGTTWVPSFSAGVDGYRLANVPNEAGLLPSALDSALHSAEGSAYRATFRTSLVGQYDLAPRRTLTLTFSAEHSNLWETVRASVPTALAPGAMREDSTRARSNSGLVGQANFAINDAIYLTGGMRVETNHGFSSDEQAAVLPMVGVAAVRDLRGVTVKGRAAFGVGARPARSAVRELAAGQARHTGESLEPERQSGFEVGADVFYRRRFALHVTAFDQRASNLIQMVAVPRDSVRGPGNYSGSGSKQLAYVLQTVGEITNRGLELESSLNLGALTLGGAFSTVDSRVRRTARSYLGDLRAGDRMLGVPAGTASLNAAWSLYGWRAGMTASRAFDWVNYDRLRLAEKFSSCSSCTASDITGAQLRSFWMKYDGVTRLRGSLSRELPRGLGVRLTVDNLTNAQRGEPDNITVLPGRTVLLGMSAKIR